MTAVKIPYRLKSPNLAYGDAFQARYQARVDRPLDDLDLSEFFMDVQDMLRPGDRVEVVSFQDTSWQQVMEWQDAIITSSRQEVAGGKSVTRAAWKDGTFGKVEPKSKAKTVESAPMKLQVKKEHGGGFTVQDMKGHVLERFKEKEDAEGYINDLNRPVAA